MRILHHAAQLVADVFSSVAIKWVSEARLDRCFQTQGLEGAENDGIYTFEGVWHESLNTVSSMCILVLTMESKLLTCIISQCCPQKCHVQLRPSDGIAYQVGR